MNLKFFSNMMSLSMTFNRKHALLQDLKSYRKKGVNTTKITCKKGDDPVKCKGSKGEIM